MLHILGILKGIGGPGSIGFLAVCLAIALALGRIGPRTRRLARRLIAALLVVYVGLGLPFVANQIAGRLSQFRPLDDLGGLRGVGTIVVIDGDNQAARVRETKRLFDALAAPTVVVSGRQPFVQSIVSAGIPADHVRRELRSRTTREQVENTTRWLRLSHTVVVASRLQMPRLAAILAAAGLHPLLASSALDAEPPRSGLRVILPTYSTLRASRDAIYEYAAIKLYRYRGWIP